MRAQSITALLGVLAILALAGCATVPTDPDELAEYHERNDPLEPTNRVVWDFDQFLDRNFIRPAAVAYRDNVPQGARNGIHNLTTNLDEPLVFANDILQANPRLAWETLARFLVNSTVGVAGIFDVAADMGIPHHGADLGQTFGVWGVPDGPYIVLPLFGPSNPRDAVGLGATMVLDPIDNIASNNGAQALVYVRGGLAGLDKRTDVIQALDDIQKTSLDYYAAIRSLSRQHRAAEIEAGRSPPPDSIPATGRIGAP